MIEALYVLVADERKAWLGLPNEAARVFLQEFVSVTADRSHPHWALRPFSLSHVIALWPGLPAAGSDPRKDPRRALRNAVLDEFLARSLGTEPDVAHLPPVAKHEHDSKTLCQQCANSIETAASQKTPTVPSLTQSLLSALDQNEWNVVPALVQALACELLAKPLSRRHLHRTALSFVLDPGKRQTGDLSTFRRRVAVFLQPEGPPPTPAPTTCLLRRSLSAKLPEGFASLPYAPRIDNSRIQRTGRAFSVLVGDIEDRSSPMELAADKLRAATEVWISYLRLALPDKNVVPTPTIDVSSSDKLRQVLPPLYRRFWSREDAGRALKRLLDARAAYQGTDQARLDAAVAWIGLAMALLNENPARAAGLVWMGLEAGFGGARRVWSTGVRVYTSRLRLELGYEIVRYVSGLRVALERPTSAQLPAWIQNAPPRAAFKTVRLYLEALLTSLQSSQHEESALLARIQEVLALFTDHAKRHQVAARARRDLNLLYAVRNGFAHSGAFETNEATAHYLATLGIEVVKSALSQAIAHWVRAPKDANGQTPQPLSLAAAWKEAPS